MIGRLIDIFIKNGAERIAVIVNEQMTEVQKYLFDLKEKLEVELDIVVKTTPSSMHSFYEVAQLLNGHGRFIATTVDTIFHENDFNRYVRAFTEAPTDVDGMMAVTTYIDDEKPLYVATDKEGFITAFLDTHEPGVKYVSGGIYGLSENSIPVLRRCIDEGVGRMRNYQRALVAAGLRLKAYDMNKILDVDHASDIEKAEAFLKS